MLIRSRLFPYPVLNQFDDLSGYNNSSFELSYDLEEDNKLNLTYLKLKYVLNNANLQKLIDEKKCKVVVLIDCSYTNFRKKYEFANSSELNLSFSRDDFLDACEVCGLIVANERIEKFSSSDFKEEYQGYEFDIDKNCILAIYQAETFYTDFEDEDSRKIESIFSVKRDETLQDGFKVDLNLNPKKIVIWVPSDTYDIYDSTKLYVDHTKDTYFSFFLVSTLTQILCEIKSEEFEDVQDVCFKYKWFKSIMKSFQTNTGKELTLEIIKEESPVYLAQKLLNNCVVKGINKYGNMLLSQLLIGEEEN